MKRKKRNSPLCRALTLLLILLVLAVGVMLIVRAYQTGRLDWALEDESAPEGLEALELDPEGEIRLAGVMTFSGSFYEDGSNDKVEKVLTVLLENTGLKAVESATLVLNGCYEFRFTSLLPGQKLYVLEANRAVFTEGLTIGSAVFSELLYYDSCPELYESVLSIEGENGKLTVRNITDDVLFPGGTLYYKNLYNGSLLGGITYSVELPPLIPGGKTEVAAKNYRKAASCAVFVEEKE